MSTPSFELFEDGKGVWWFETTLGAKGGRPRKISTHVKDKDAAKVIARDKLTRMTNASEASKLRWEAEYKRKAPPKDSKSTVVAPVLKAQGLLGPVAGDDHPPAAAPASPSSNGVHVEATVRAAEIADKLRKRGGVTDGEPEKKIEEVPPEEVKVIPPKRPAGEVPDDEDDPELEDLDDDELEDLDDEESGGKDDRPEGADDAEAAEFISEMVVEGAVTGAIKAGTKFAKSDRVPILGFKKKRRTPNEPSEKAEKYARKNLVKVVNRFMSNKVKLSPGMGAVLGLVGIFVSMQVGADELEPDDARPAAGSSPRPAPAPPPRPQQQAEPDGEQQLPLRVVPRGEEDADSSALGRFK